MEKLVYAELTSSVTFEMLQDKLVAIISDTGVFIITTPENALNYNEDFYPVDAESRKTYGLEYRDGRVFQKPQTGAVSEPHFRYQSLKATTGNTSGNWFHYVKK